MLYGNLLDLDAFLERGRTARSRRAATGWATASGNRSTSARMMVRMVMVMVVLVLVLTQHSWWAASGRRRHRG